MQKNFSILIAAFLATHTIWIMLACWIFKYLCFECKFNQWYLDKTF